MMDSEGLNVRRRSDPVGFYVYVTHVGGSGGLLRVHLESAFLTLEEFGRLTEASPLTAWRRDRAGHVFVEVTLLELPLVMKRLAEVYTLRFAAGER